MDKYGVQSAASITHVCKIQSAIAKRAPLDVTTKRSINR